LSLLPNQGITMSLIDKNLIAAHNDRLLRHVNNDYAHLGEQLARRATCSTSSKTAA